MEILREDLENQMENMTMEQILEAVIANEVMTYYETEEAEVQKQNIRNICELADRVVKFKEVNAVENKAEQEAEIKLKMNENDNNTKLQIAKMEKATADAKTAIEGCEGIVDILTGAGKALGAVALTGLIVNWECEGYVPGKSGAFRIMSDLGKAFLKK